jgi:16S rRNA C967 or C1407 C5-methylase (RsmB/RsmF family)
MKKYTYLDMVKTLLPEEEFLEFKQRYDKPIRKSIKILKSKGEFAVIKEKLSKEGRKLEAPTLSRKGKVYDDVLFVEKQDKQSLGSHLLHQEGKFYVQEMSAGMPAQLLLAHP